MSFCFVTIEEKKGKVGVTVGILSTEQLSFHLLGLFAKVTTGSLAKKKTSPKGRANQDVNRKMLAVFMSRTAAFKVDNKVVFNEFSFYFMVLTSKCVPTIPTRAPLHFPSEQKGCDM